MPTYRICTVGSDGSLIAGEDIECADDQEATEKASQAAKDSGIELWQRDRCVIHLLPAPSPNWNFPSVTPTKAQTNCRALGRPYDKPSPFKPLARATVSGARTSPVGDQPLNRSFRIIRPFGVTSVTCITAPHYQTSRPS